MIGHEATGKEDGTRSPPVPGAGAGSRPGPAGGKKISCDRTPPSAQHGGIAKNNNAFHSGYDSW